MKQKGSILTSILMKTLSFDRLLELYKITHDISGNLVTNAEGALWTPKNEKQLATFNAQARMTGMLVTIKK